MYTITLSILTVTYVILFVFCSTRVYVRYPIERRVRYEHLVNTSFLFNVALGTIPQNKKHQSGYVNTFLVTHHSTGNALQKYFGTT